MRIDRIVQVAAVAAVAFVALGALVASGAANGLDQWADTHAMPLASRPGPPPTLFDSLIPQATFHPIGVAVTDFVAMPGQLVLSFLLVIAAAWRLWRSGRVDAAIAWTAAWLLAVGVEVILRHTLTRPSLYRDGVHVLAFDSSWPSGHALRGAIVVGALASAWPVLRAPLLVWLVAAAVLLELGGFHTPTDVVGGLLLATVAVAGAVALERSGLLRRRGLRRRTLRSARPGT